MKPKRLFLYVAFLGSCLLQKNIAAQDSVLHRIILIGDAGEIDKEQQAIIPDAASKIIKQKTTTLFLGDNIYPKGMGLAGTKDELRGQKILQAQYEALRKQGSAVYFIPGNHDWDKSGKNGLAKIQRQWNYLQEQNDSLLKLVPPNGCPDPVEIPVTDDVVIIAFDSEWWLYPFDKENNEAECDCKSTADVIGKMEELFYRNKNKTILLASHHPFQSYGTHGGNFSWKDHLFPLRAVKKNAYIPLPLIGSLYPILRKTFTNPEDLRHPLYKNMVQVIDGIFSSSPNVIHVAGHEHGLQLIDNTNTKQLQIVSGGGAKENHTIKGKYSLYGRAGQGYVVADIMQDKTVRLHYYTYEKDIISESFSYHFIPKDIQKTEELYYPPVNGDSIAIAIRPSYNQPGNFHRRLFGENYRKEFSTPVQLPVIRLSTIYGGLTPEKRGGGMQTVSLRLIDKNKKEWVLRSLEKNPDPLLPAALRRSLARDILDDYMSAQYPFAPLIMPPLANAAGVPHANPVIGLIAPDNSLGIYKKLFANKVALLEEREPIGESENTPKMDKDVKNDNDTKIDGVAFFQARLLDLLVSDWDRHADQWRWAPNDKKKNKIYTGVPRDRDQALYKNQGIIPWFASRSWALPTLQGYDATIKRVHFSLLKTNFINAYLSGQLTHAQWTNATEVFTKKITDSVIDHAFSKIPAEAYAIRGASLAATMKKRRDNMPAAMEKFYRFIHKTVDLKASDKNELFSINSTAEGNLFITVQKINKDGIATDTLLSKLYEKSITKEIRIYLLKGDDSVFINNSNSPVRLRIIGGKGDKHYAIQNAVKRIRVYDRPKGFQLSGATNKVITHLSKDSSNTAFVQTNPYNITMPLATAGFNLDDGFLFGLGFKYTQQGFRKSPYASTHQLLASHSLSTKAYRIRYKSEWLQAIGKADIVLNALIKAPDNTQNFFGTGNTTQFDKTGDFKRYYRTRFGIYQTDVMLRWNGNKNSTFSIGPSLQLYVYDKEDNKGRFITNTSLVGSYDSATVDKRKIHAGLSMQFVNDTRNNIVFPTWGSYIRVKVTGYKGVTGYSRSFTQIVPEIAFYKNLNAAQTIIIANRTGGGITIGNAAFYQSIFIGGHENLLGYRQYRFAGNHAVYNNLEIRFKLADVGNYILPGQFGLVTFFDMGRVWQKNEASRKMHTGTGGGFYFAPASMAVLQMVAGYSAEGWLPYFSFGFRF